MWKRYIIELGWGADLHGQNVTKAARKAVKDAISRSCLCGMDEILSMQDFDEMQVHVGIATPYPNLVDKEKVLEVLPFGKKTLKVMEGGLETPGMYVKALGDSKDSIVVANAVVEVYVMLED
ncbi:Lin0512 family protein [Bacillus tuaregi]|uniref:Lin0512 family protein n=1 Tax=Bacillus tuaregi TaxID=1816695 RepID=UPI0008F888EF|nr:Lin0512 family protein [Bacillus tuaregi]